MAIVIFVAIIAVLLILVVLVQNSKGGGLSSEFAGTGSSQMFGVKKTTDLLEQITWGLAISIMAIALVSYILVGEGTQAGESVNSVNIEKAQSTPLPGGNIAPAVPGATSPGPSGADAPGAVTPEGTAPATSPTDTSN
ncbi:preprotein translocase subunit SecG [Rhabdobacter roseus]|uniref:Protein-export membrane protein SecG n=1 Tax=Rhabdobacter roseus TaxID=1655419 RepID=A0A840TTR6_9BACT|nr:preprotein translocase subunit SecG [Rhabdobacter roseus]